MRDGDLVALREAGILDDKKLAEITAFLADRQNAQPVSATAAPAARFDLTHLLWYGGALIIVGAMGLFTTDAFNRMGGWALAACGAAYLVVLALLGEYLWSKRNLRIPGGLMIAAAISMVPMIIYGVQDALDLWKYALGDPGEYKRFFPYIHGSWIYMEAATVIAALIAIVRYRFPFILLMAGVALWFMSMDLAKWFMQGAEGINDYTYDYNIRRTVSMWFGIVMIGIAWAWDIIKGRTPDMMFWIHLFGALCFWGGLSLHDGGTALTKFIYCMINVGLLAFSLFIDRRIYAVLGAFGIAGYLGYLARDVFQDMIGFSFALSAIGLAIMFLGLWLHKNRQRMSASLSTVLPDFLVRLRPADAD
jgi:hypothetical protein